MWCGPPSASLARIKHAVRAVQVKCGLVFAVLLNRLSANTMPDTWKPQAWRGRSTSVKVTAKGPTMTSPGELMRAITDELGAHVQMKVVSRVTSFGQGPPHHPCIAPHLAIVRRSHALSQRVPTSTMHCGATNEGEGI